MDFQHIREYTRALVALYVEDDADMRESTSELFESYFKSIDTAEDGKAGYEKYIEYQNDNDKFYDIVITDINMPGQSGIEMIRKIQAQNIAQPVLIISAHTEPHHLLDAIDLNVASFIVKPLNLDKLLQALHKTSKLVVEQNLMELYQSETEKETVELNRTNRQLLEEIERLKNTTPSSQDDVSTNTALHVKRNKRQNRSVQEVQNALLDKQPFLIDDMTEMTLTLEDIDQVLNLYATGNLELNNFSIRVGERIKHYGGILGYYDAFLSLSDHISDLGQIIEYEAFSGSEKEVQTFTKFLQNFCNTLQQWQEQLPNVSLQNLNDFDDSISSDIIAMKALWRVNGK